VAGFGDVAGYVVRQPRLQPLCQVSRDARNTAASVVCSPCRLHSPTTNHPSTTSYFFPTLISHAERVFTPIAGVGVVLVVELFALRVWWKSLARDPKSSEPPPFAHGELPPTLKEFNEDHPRPLSHQRGKHSDMRGQQPQLPARVHVTNSSVP
jgi:hypothetical protein